MPGWAAVSRRLATLTVSPQTSYTNFFVPSTPATTGPAWRPIRTCHRGSAAATASSIARARSAAAATCAAGSGRVPPAGASPPARRVSSPAAARYASPIVLIFSTPNRSQASSNAENIALSSSTRTAGRSCDETSVNPTKSLNTTATDSCRSAIRVSPAASRSTIASGSTLSSSSRERARSTSRSRISRSSTVALVSRIASSDSRFDSSRASRRSRRAFAFASASADGAGSSVTCPGGASRTSR